MSTIGERIKTARLDRGINQRRLCELANITETTLSRYENGTREPQAANIGKIARVLNVSTDYLIGTNDDNIPDILKFPLRSDSYVDSVQYKISETIKYNYIKNLVTELKNNYGKDVYKLASDISLNIVTLESDLCYNFHAVYNNIGRVHFLFLNPLIPQEEEKAIITHIIGYMILFNSPNPYYLFNFNNSNTFDMGQRANIFAAEYLIDDDIFIRALALGNDIAIANDLQVPVNFIEHKRNLITK